MNMDRCNKSIKLISQIVRFFSNCELLWKKWGCIKSINPSHDRLWLLKSKRADLALGWRTSNSGIRYINYKTRLYRVFFSRSSFSLQISSFPQIRCAKWTEPTKQMIISGLRYRYVLTGKNYATQRFTSGIFWCEVDCCRHGKNAAAHKKDPITCLQCMSSCPSVTRLTSVCACLRSTHHAYLL